MDTAESVSSSAVQTTLGKRKRVSKEKKLRSSRNQDKARYLYVSTGCVIYLLDLKQRGIADGALPTVASLNLIEKGYPCCAGLFSLGSDTFMIGGNEFSVDLLKPIPSGHNLLQSLLRCRPVTGTSNATYRLCVAEDHTSITPSSTDCNIPDMRRPKFWPVVEEIDGKIHVFDSIPCAIMCWMDLGWSFSHEVKEEGGGWAEITTTGFPSGFTVAKHVVVGHRIYAVCGDMHLVFDRLQKRIWESETVKYHYDGPHASSATTVWELLQCVAAARCVGEFEFAKEKLYVILAPVRTNGYDDPDSADIRRGGYFAMGAYLVNSIGKIICMQVVPFFKVKKGQLYRLCDANVVNADEEGKTISAIVSGDIIRKGGSVDEGYLLINTFIVKPIVGADSKVRQLMADSIHYGYELGAMRTLNFVRLRVKDTHVYKLDAQAGVVFKACFQK